MSNRADRRARLHPRHQRSNSNTLAHLQAAQGANLPPEAPEALVRPLPADPSQNRSVPLSPATAGGSPGARSLPRREASVVSEARAMAAGLLSDDVPPADRGDGGVPPAWEDVQPAPVKSGKHPGGRPPGAKNKATVAKLSHDAQLVQTLTGYHAAAGLVVWKANEYDGTVIIGQARACGAGLVAAAKDLERRGHPEVMQALEMITVAGPYMTLMMAYGTIIVAILINHAVLPRGLGEMMQLDPMPPERVEPAERSKREGHPIQPSVPTFSDMGAGVAPVSPRPAPEDVSATLGPPSPPVSPHTPPMTALGSLPDEGLPHEAELMIRQAATRLGRPYEEVKAQMVAELRAAGAFNGSLPPTSPQYQAHKLGEVIE